MEIQLGFSTGCLYESGLHERKKLELVAAAGCKVVELGFVKLADFLGKQLAQFAVLTTADFAPFDYVSLHAPIYAYGHDKQTERIFNLIRNFHISIGFLDLVIFRPDTVQDFSVFENRGFPVAFENMDNRKPKCKTPPEMLDIFSQIEDARMVLDVNHAFTMDIDDAECRLTSDFWQKLYPWIDQIHLSGYAPPEHNHWPLFKTKQDFIIRSIENFTKPIIIESVLTPDELAQERDHVLSVISDQ